MTKAFLDLNGLPIDGRRLLARIRRWVEVESPSWNGLAVSRVAALAAEELRELGAAVHIYAGRNGYGDCVLGDFAPTDPTPGILLLGHMDTVHEIGSLAGPMPWREAEGRCYGPGLFDMKSGNCMALEAIRQLRAAGIATPLPLRFLFTPDEESGSPTSRGLIEATARRQKYVLVPEGAQPNGSLVSGRFPSCRLCLWTHGKPGHALIDREIGRSALATMARIVLEIEALNGAGCAYTVTYVHAGQTVATVPVQAYAELVCTSQSAEALEYGINSVRHIGLGDPDARVTVEIKTARPLWTPSVSDNAMWEQARQIGEEIGLPLACEMQFGGSDGNFTGALGVTTLDGLGVVGADAHQLTERIEIATLAPRTRLMAGLMATLS